MALILLILPSDGFGGVPPLLNFQGRIVIGGVSFNGTGQFQFALVNMPDGTNTLWSNDGTSSGGSEPGTAVSMTMTNGLYAVLLGDTNLVGMTEPLNPCLFTNADVQLRVWFNDGTHGFEQLTPDQRIASAGYALVAGAAENFYGNISSAQLPGNLATTNFIISQGYVTAAITNDLASTNYVIAATNGLAPTDFVLTMGQNVTNYVNTATNGFVTAAITNGLASTDYVNSLTNGSMPVTWGTTPGQMTNSGQATIYFYVTNGQPVFGIFTIHN